MPTERFPRWVTGLIDRVTPTVQLGGAEGLEVYYTRHDALWGVPVVEVAPPLVEVVSGGQFDGELLVPTVDSIDLLELAQAFDAVDSLTLSPDDGGALCVTVEGRVGTREVVVLVYTRPVPDAEPEGTIDGTELTTRPPRGRGTRG